MKVNTLRLHLLLAAPLIVSSALVVNAPAPGSSRNGGLPSGEGNVMLWCRIYFPSGQTASGRTSKVSLESASAFGGGSSQTAFGPRGAATALSRATSIAVVVFMLTSMALTIRATKKAGGGSVLEKLPTQSQPQQK